VERGGEGWGVGVGVGGAGSDRSFWVLAKNQGRDLTEEFTVKATRTE